MRKQKFLSVLLAVALLFSLVLPTNSAVMAEEQGTKSVTLHKLLMSKEDLAKWNSNTVEAGDAGQSINGYNAQDALNLAQMKTLLGLTNEPKDIGGVVFAWQNNSDQFINAQGKPVYVDAAGENVTSAGGSNRLITPADKAFTETNVLMGTTADNTGKKFDTSKLPAGEYKIVEVKELSTYTGADGELLTGSKAVPVEITLPVVNDKGVVENAVVYPKNTEDGPKIDKNYAKDNGLTPAELLDQGKELGADYARYQEEKATAQATVGKVLPYEIKTSIPQNSEYKTLRWTDRMTHGITFNNDLEIKLEGVKLVATTDYTLKADLSGFSVTLTATGLEKVRTQATVKDVEFVLTYTGTVNATAIVDMPDKNEVTLEYGNEPEEEHDPVEKNPHDGQITVDKSWTEGNAPAGVSVTYDLQVKEGSSWRTVETVTVTNTDGSNPKLGHVFTGLEDSQTYRVIERPMGYTPEYTDGGDGTINIMNRKNKNPKPKKPTTPEVVTYGRKFVKTNFDGSERLQGAQFIILNQAKDKYLAYVDGATQTANKEAAKKAQEAYMDAFLLGESIRKIEEGSRTPDQITLLAKLDGDTSTEGSILNLEHKRNAAFRTASYAYEWKTGTSKQADAVVLTSNEQGQFAIGGLEDGTYYLMETQAPNGYATSYDSTTSALEFVVGPGTYERDAAGMEYTDKSGVNDAKQVVNKKIDIPQTGGIGTVIFTVVGLAVMALAVFAMKRRNQADEA